MSGPVMPQKNVSVFQRRKGSGRRLLTVKSVAFAVFSEVLA